MFNFETNPTMFKKLHWQSDLDAIDIGCKGNFVVGYYTYHDLNLYINMETLQIMEAWFDEDEE